MSFQPTENQILPDDCPLLEEHHKLRDFIMGLNPEISKYFGPQTKIDIQRVNPGSAEYKEVGFRWFIILPWPQIPKKDCKKLSTYISTRIRLFEASIEVESFGITRSVAGGALALMVGLREKRPV